MFGGERGGTAAEKTSIKKDKWNESQSREGYGGGRAWLILHLCWCVCVCSFTGTRPCKPPHDQKKSSNEGRRREGPTTTTKVDEVHVHFMKTTTTGLPFRAILSGDPTSLFHRFCPLPRGGRVAQTTRAQIYSHGRGYSSEKKKHRVPRLLPRQRGRISKSHQIGATLRLMARNVRHCSHLRGEREMAVGLEGE